MSTRIALVAPPGDGSSGIGTYADDLVCRLQDHLEVTRVCLDPDRGGLLQFAGSALRAVRVGEVIHVQHEYGLFGPGAVLSWVFFPLLWILARATRTPTVLTLHEVIDGKDARPPWRRLKGGYLRGVNALLRATADHVVFLSPVAADRFGDRMDRDGYTVLSHGTDIEPRTDLDPEEAKEALGYDPGTPLVVEPGYVSPRKGSDVVVDLAERRPDWEFLLAGGAETGREQFVDRLRRRAPENLRITGRLDDRRFEVAIRAADVAVLPYRPPDDRGFENRVHQSGAFNRCVANRTPVVASACQYFEYVRDRWGCVALFDVEDRDDLCCQVDRLVDDPGERSVLTEGMDGFAAENSYERIANRHVELYSELTR